MRKIMISCIIVIVIATIGIISIANGEIASGLYVEKSTSTNHVFVKRIRDTEEGVLCYLATTTHFTEDYRYATSPSISCVKMK